MKSTFDEVIAKARRRRSLPPAEERRNIRERAHLRQVDLAQALRVDVSTIDRWESGFTPRGRSYDAYALLLERIQNEVLLAVGEKKRA